MKKSCKGSNCLAYEEKLIDEIDPHQDTSRGGKFNRAIEKAKTVTKKDWVKLSKDLKKFKNEIPSDIVAPTALQVKVNEELESDLAEIESTLKHALTLTKLQTRYEFEILWLNYLNCLKSEVLNVGETRETKERNLTGPDMAKILVKILLLNRDADKSVIDKVKSALLEWEGNDYEASV